MRYGQFFAHFCYPPKLNTKFEDVFLALHCSILHLERINYDYNNLRSYSNYWCKEFSLKTYPLASVRQLHTDGRQPYHKRDRYYGRLKTVDILGTR